MPHTPFYSAVKSKSSLFFNPTAASETADQPSLLKYFLYLILKQYINVISSKSSAIPSQSLCWFFLSSLGSKSGDNDLFYKGAESKYFKF